MNFLSKKITNIHKQSKIYFLSLIISTLIISIFSLIESRFVDSRGYILNYTISYQKQGSYKRDIENKIAIQLFLGHVNFEFFQFNYMKMYFGNLLVSDNICERERTELQNDPSIVSNLENLRIKIFFKRESSAKKCAEILKNYTFPLSNNFKRLANDFIELNKNKEKNFSHLKLFLNNIKNLNIYNDSYKIIHVTQNSKKILYFLVIFILLVLLFNEKKIIYILFTKPKNNKK